MADEHPDSLSVRHVAGSRRGALLAHLDHVGRFVRDRRGVTTLEYALLIFAILLVVAGGYRLLGKRGSEAATAANDTLLGQNVSPHPGNVSPGGGDVTGGGGTVCDGRSCGAPGQCFVAGTLVATPSGDRPIESLRAGEIVLTRNDLDDVVEARPIARTFVRLAPSLVDVHVVTLDDTRESVRSTPEHLYFTRDRGWLGAGDLVAGEALMDRAGREVQVTKVVPIAQEAIVYNLEVDADHTYFVGRSAVWVHNQPCGGPGGAPGITPPAGPAPPVVQTGPVLGSGGGASAGGAGAGGPTPAEAALTAAAEAALQASVNTVPGSDYADYMRRAEQAKLNNPALAGIPTYQLAGVIGYTSADYKAINPALRTGNIGSLGPYIDAATQGLGRLPDYNGSVYRGTSLDPKYLAPYQVGQTVQESAFTSTSYSTKVATDFQTMTPKPGDVKVLYLIESKHGKKVSEFSKYPNESEVLFPPNTQFKVVERTDKNGVIRIKMVEV